jgi:ligand-binding SRPBCC domain-containing protein
MMPEGPESCRLEDRVEYELPLGLIGDLFGGWFVDKKLRKLFRYRHNVTAEAFTNPSIKGLSPEVA